MPALRQFKKGSKLVHGQQRARQKRARRNQKAAKR
jgi:hypothetical protein